jgi:hypothetical protein
VVTEGGDRLRDGAPVQLPAAAGAPAAGSPAAASSDDARPRGARPPGAPHRRSRANSPQ